MAQSESDLEASGFYTRRGARSVLCERFPSVLRAVTCESSVAGLATAIAEALVAELDALSAVVHFADADGRTLRLASWRGVPTDPLDVIAIEAALPVARAARSGAMQVASQPVGTSFAVPLCAGSRLLGVVSGELGARAQPRDLEMLESLAAVLGALVDRARLADERSAREGWTRVVAHELRQPLHTISLDATWLSRVVAPGDQVSSVKHVLDGVSRVQRLLCDLLDTSVVDASQLPLRLRSTDLTELVRGLVGSTADDETPRVRVEVHGPLPEVSVDPERIQQVLANLLVNATKYGSAGSEIRLDIERRGDEVALSVTNDGADIPDEEQPRLFERYYRARNAKVEGWGIGLYVCRALVQAHGGRISLRSGGGSTTFCVELPISRRTSDGAGSVGGRDGVPVHHESGTRLSRARRPSA